MWKSLSDDYKEEQYHNQSSANLSPSTTFNNNHHPIVSIGERNHNDYWIKVKYAHKDMIIDSIIVIDHDKNIFYDINYQIILNHQKLHLLMILLTQIVK